MAYMTELIHNSFFRHKGHKPFSFFSRALPLIQFAALIDEVLCVTSRAIEALHSRVY